MNKQNKVAYDSTCKYICMNVGYCLIRICVCIISACAIAFPLWSAKHLICKTCDSMQCWDFSKYRCILSNPWYKYMCEDYLEWLDLPLTHTHSYRLGVAARCDRKPVIDNSFNDYCIHTSHINRIKKKSAE